MYFLVGKSLRGVPPWHYSASIQVAGPRVSRGATARQAGEKLLVLPTLGRPPVLRICGELWGAQICLASGSQQGASWWQQAREISGGLSITAWGSEVGDTPSPSLRHFCESTARFRSLPTISLEESFCWFLNLAKYGIQIIFYVIIILFLILK